MELGICDKRNGNYTSIVSFHIHTLSSVRPDLSKRLFVPRRDEDNAYRWNLTIRDGLSTFGTNKQISPNSSIILVEVKFEFQPLCGLFYEFLHHQNTFEHLFGKSVMATG